MGSQPGIGKRTLPFGTTELLKHVSACRLWSSGLTLLLLSPACVTAGEAEGFTESVVIFNTVCAKCHEGECSGRLSFDQAREASVNHILRHYTPATGKHRLQRELFDILNYMKEKCAYYPLQVPIPPGRVWDSGLLERMTIVPEYNYFVPLGPLSAGRYRLRLELEQDASVLIQLVSDAFEMAVEATLSSSAGQLDIPFSIDEPGDYYFRMYPQESVRLTRLAITSGKSGVDTPSQE